MYLFIVVVNTIPFGEGKGTGQMYFSKVDSKCSQLLTAGELLMTD